MSDQVQEFKRESLFGMDEEFAAPIMPAGEQPVETKEEKLVEKEFDFGGEKIKLSAANYDELIEKYIAERDRRAEESLFKTDTEERRLPQPKKYDTLPEPTADDLAAIVLRFNQDPVGAIDEALAYRIGMPVDQFMDKLNRMDDAYQMIYGEMLGREFVFRHQRFDEEGNHIGGDYYACPENARKMEKYLKAKDLPQTRENLELAYSELKRENALKDYPKNFFKKNSEESIKKPVSTALSGLDSQYPTQKELSAKEAEQMFYDMPLDKLRAAVKGRG